MEKSIKTSRKEHNVNSELLKSISRLNEDSLQMLEDTIMGYVNYLYGDFIEEHLRMDPQFRHLFVNKHSMLGNSIFLEEKNREKHECDFQKKTLKYKIANQEPKKLLDKVEAKSKIIRKSCKTKLKNVAHVRDISGNNLGSFFLKTDSNLCKCNENHRAIEKLNSIVQLETKNFQCDKKDYSKEDNQTFFFIINKSHVENPIIPTNNNLPDRDLKLKNFNENIQQNEIYFSNSDYENNFSKNLSNKCERNYFNNLSNKTDVEKDQRDKNYYKEKNKIKVGTESITKISRDNSKKNSTQTALDIHKSTNTELKKTDRYKYNSGGKLKSCKNIFKEKYSYNFQNFRGNKKDIFSVTNIKLANSKDIAQRPSKQDVKCMNILSDSGQNLNSQSKVIAEDSLTTRFFLYNKECLRVEYKASKMSEFTVGLCSQKIQEENNLKSSANIVPNNFSKINKMHNFNHIGGSEEINNYVDGIDILNSTSDLNKIISPQENKISLENSKITENKTEKLKDDKSETGAKNNADNELYLKKYNEIDAQGLEEMASSREIQEKQNLSDQCKNRSCTLTFSEVIPGNQKSGQSEDECTTYKHIVKSVSPITDVFSSKKMNNNWNTLSDIGSNMNKNLQNNLEYSKDEVMFQKNNEHFMNPIQKCSQHNDEHISYVCYMKKDSLESDAPEVYEHKKHVDKMKNCDYSSLRVANETDINSNTNSEINNEQWSNIQQTINSITEDCKIPEKIERVSSVQLKDETVTHSEKTKINVSLDSLKNEATYFNDMKGKIKKSIPLNKISIRSSLRNKTGAIVKNDVEAHMLVKITYDKGTSRKSNKCKEQENFISEANEKSIRNGNVKANIENVSKKSNSFYNLRSISKQNT